MRLLVTAGPDKGREYELSDSKTFVLGRSADLPNCLTDPHVSRRHCEISVNGFTVTLNDSGSRSGTYVNGHPIKTAVLKSGNTIRIGETELQFQMAGSGSGETTLGTAPRSTPSPDAEITDDLGGLVGRQIHNYRLERIIARGRTGWVFHATHTKHDRDLAVKVIYPSITKVEEETQRFVRAMQTMFPLRHPNIVRLYNAGIDRPYCWLAMEYVDGESLTEIIRRIGMVGMLPWDYSFRVAVHVARALEAASDLNVIHRNICPSNILVSKRDQVAKLGDLMLAKAMEGINSDHITKPGEIVGDLAYMSPERTVGPFGVDTRSDIYSLGATLYATLTGHPPFEDSSLPALITKIRSAEPARPKTFQLSINDMFEGIVLRCLAKRPEDRYQTATKLLIDLKRVAMFANITI